MSRILSFATALVCAAVVSCGGLPGMGGGSGGGGAYKPTECFNNQFPGDLSNAKEGQEVVYATEASGQTTTQTVKVVGKEGADYLVEQWVDMPSMGYGLLFLVGADKKIKKAWAAPKDGKEWTSIPVKDPPAAQAGDAPKPTIKESSEKKEVPAGAFSAKRLDVTVNVQGKDYTSVSWFSKDVPPIYMGSEHGGVVATEASGSKTSLKSLKKDAKATIELPKK